MNQKRDMSNFAQNFTNSRERERDELVRHGGLSTGASFGRPSLFNKRLQLGAVPKSAAFAFRMRCVSPLSLTVCDGHFGCWYSSILTSLKDRG